MKLEAGKNFGLYKILSPIGAGGMGEVYLAEDTRLRRKIVLKVLPADLSGDAGYAGTQRGGISPNARRKRQDACRTKQGF